MKVSKLLTIKVKFISLAIFFVVITAFVTNQIYFRNSKDILVKAEISALDDEARLLLSFLRKQINELKIDVRALYARPSLLLVIEEKSKRNLDALAINFRELLQSKPYYTQVSYLNENGLEKIRLDRRGGVVLRTPSARLQNKSDTIYFNDAVQMEPGQVYLSDINPSRANGQVIRPVVNVLRAAIPVFRKDESLDGVLIVNLNISRLLSELNEETKSKRVLYVTNTEGEYLWHPERDKILGVKREQFTIQDEFPKSEQVIEGDKRRLLAY